MKKIGALFLSTYLILFLAACGESLDDTLSDIEKEVSQEQSTEEEGGASQEQSNEMKDEEEQEEPSEEKTEDETITRDEAYDITTDLVDEANEIASDFREEKEVMDVVMDDDKLEEYEKELKPLLEPIVVEEFLENLTEIISYERLETVHPRTGINSDMIDVQFQVLDQGSKQGNEFLHISYATLETEMGSTPTGVTDIQFVKDDQWKISNIGHTSFEEQPLNLTKEDIEEVGHEYIEELEHEGETYIVYREKEYDSVMYRHVKDGSIAYDVKGIYENDQGEASEDTEENESSTDDDESETSQESDESNESYLSQLEWPSGIEFESYHVENAEEYLEFEYEYPVFGHEVLDELIDERVNGFNDRWGYVEELIDNNETMPGGQAANLKFAPPYTYNDERISMFMRTYFYEGGTHGLTSHTALNYDLTTGEAIPLTDQLEMLGISEEEFIEKSINQLEQYEHSDGFFDDWKETVLNEDIDNISYAVSDNILSIRYPAYYLGPYSIGYPLIDIPLE